MQTAHVHDSLHRRHALNQGYHEGSRPPPELGRPASRILWLPKLSNTPHSNDQIPSHDSFEALGVSDVEPLPDDL